MTATVLDRIADLVPPSSGCDDDAPTDPLLRTAVGLWRAGHQRAGWVPADGWPNEGRGGSALDLRAATDGGDTLGVVDGVGTIPVADDLVDPELVSGPGGFDIGFNSGDADDGANDFGFYGDFPLDMSGPFAITLDYTPLGTGLTSMRYLRKGFPFGHPGFVMEEATGFGGFISAAIDGDNFVYSPPTIEGFLGITPLAAIAGRQQMTLGFDGTTAFAYRKGVLLTSQAFPNFEDASVDLPLIVGPGQTVHNIVFHRGAAAAALDVPALHTALAAS